jgi:arylsulfatase A-like enzyme
MYHSQSHPEAAFATMITRIDLDVQRIQDELKKLGIDDNTIVIFSSDNGPHKEAGNDPYYFNSNGSQRGIKRDLYEGGIRIPLIVKWPGMIKSGQVSDHISAFWDMLPTFADLAHVSIADVPTEGISLAPTLFGNPDKQEQHPYLYWEFHENKYSDQAVRKGKWKAVRHDPDAVAELYNLEEDPKEQNDLANQFPAIVMELQTLMNQSRTENPYFPLKRSAAN